MKDVHDIISEHLEGHRTDKPDHGIASTPQIKWLRNISETLDAILVILSDRAGMDT